MRFRKLKQQLEWNGWVHERTAGSHHIFFKKDHGLLPVPVHNREVSQEMLDVILPQIYKANQSDLLQSLLKSGLREDLQSLATGLRKSGLRKSLGAIVEDVPDEVNLNLVQV